MNHIIVTANGKRLLARAAAGEVSVVFTRMGTSSAEYEEGELETLSELKNLLQQVEISNVEVEDDTTIVISSHVDNRELEAGYYITAIGIFAKAEGEEEILYAVSLVSNTPYMPDHSTTLTGVSFRFTLKVGDSSNITIHVDELTSVTEGEFHAYKMKMDERFAKMEFLEFEDYISEDAEILDPEESINQITSGKSRSHLMQYVKVSLKGVLNLGQKALNVAMGRNQARVFATVEALDTWLAVPANVQQLNVGDNFYITALDVPDYWWDGNQKQKLETQKVDLTTYDQRITANASSISELYGKTVTLHQMDDLNDATEPGLYAIKQTTLHSPLEESNGLVRVEKYNAHSFIQIAYECIEVTKMSMYIRRYNSLEGTYGNWIKYITQEDFTGIFTTVEYTYDNPTVPGGGVTGPIEPTAMNIPDGYTPVAIRSFAVGNNAVLRNLNIFNGQVYVVNLSSNTITPTIIVRALCVKSNLMV